MFKNIRRILYKYLFRHNLFKLFMIILFIWIVGSIMLFLVEHNVKVYDEDGKPVKNEFQTISDSFWNMTIYLFSGFDTGSPNTTMGKIIVTFILISSLGFVGYFTATIASVFVENTLQGRYKMPSKELSGQIVICNWNFKGLQIIKEIHNPVLKIRRPIVILTENTDKIIFPDTEDEAFNDVFLLKGDPANEIMLKRANIMNAYSVIILADSEQGKYTDAKSVLIALSIKNISADIYTIAEVNDPTVIPHFDKAGVNEIVSSAHLGHQVIAQAAITHGISRFYKNLLTFSKDTNEVYLVDLPDKFVGRTFAEVSIELAKTRSSSPVIPVGVKRNSYIHINPDSGKLGALTASDKLFVIAYERPEL